MITDCQILGIGETSDLGAIKRAFRARAKELHPDLATGDETLKRHPAYGFYKTGMRYFSAIHPSQWNLDTHRMLNTAIAGHGEEQDRIKRKVMDLVKLFPKAYYYFSIVVHEYPDSDWAYDAGRKLGTIEERVRRYRRIIESFSTWNVDEKERSREYHEKYDATLETQKAVRRDGPKEWER